MAHMTLGVDLLLASFTALYLGKLIVGEVLLSGSPFSGSVISSNGAKLGGMKFTGAHLLAAAVREKRSLLNQHVAERSFS